MPPPHQPCWVSHPHPTHAPSPDPPNLCTSHTSSLTCALQCVQAGEQVQPVYYPSEARGSVEPQLLCYLLG